MRRRSLIESWRTAIPIGLACACVLAAALSITRKVRAGYRIVSVDRESSWRVTLAMDVEARGKDTTVRCMAPVATSSRQRILSQTFMDDGFTRSTEGNYVVWTRPAFSGQTRLVMKYRAKTEARRYPLPEVLEWEDLDVTGLESYLAPGRRIQVDHEDIRAHAELLRQSTDDIMDFVKALFKYVYRDVAYRRVGGPTDSLTAYRLREASCNGKNRLFVGLARSQGIPARPAKGLILEQGSSKSVTHMWSELYLDGQWVPFCPTSGYFAEIPAKYLEYPKVDQSMFRYTKNVRFSHQFTMAKGVQTMEEALKADLDHPHHLLRAWGSLNKGGFSLDLLLVLLLIPVGATLVSFMRNVVGLTPVGTFLPALIAVSFRDTGLGWGLAMFCAVVAVGVFLNEGLRQLHLLHFPRLTVVLVATVVCIIGLAVLALRFDNDRAASVGMFPLAIMTLTIERVSIIRDRLSLKDALYRLATSLVVASLCYGVMMNFAVRSAMLVFPELLLVCVAINLLMGTYTGLRCTEWFRFKILRQEVNR